MKVAPGHFRNHLMPKLLAVPNIDKFAYLVSEQRKVHYFFSKIGFLCMCICLMVDA